MIIIIILVTISNNKKEKEKKDTSIWAKKVFLAATCLIFCGWGLLAVTEVEGGTGGLPFPVGLGDV